MWAGFGDAGLAIDAAPPVDLILTASLGALLSPIVGGRACGRVDFSVAQGVAGRLAFCLSCVLGISLIADTERSVPLDWAASWLAGAVLLVLLGRFLAGGLLRAAAKRFGADRVYVLGSGAAGDTLRRALSEAELPGIEVVRPRDRATSFDEAVRDLLEQGRRAPIDRVIVAQADLSEARLEEVRRQLRGLRVELSALFPLAEPDCATARLGEFPLFAVSRRPQWGYGGLFKYVFDRAVALLLLLWVSPLVVLIAASIRVDSKGPILFRQRRQGIDGREFEIFKFRTMAWQGSGAGNGAVQTRRGDERITRIGAFLRQTSLDEVPQLLNVLNGTMSLVGPRPHPLAMRTEERTGDEITPEYAHRHRVKPGITGWAQIHGLRGATDTADKLRRRVEHDNFYIDNWSPWLDLRILVMTPISLLTRRDNAF